MIFIETFEIVVCIWFAVLIFALLSYPVILIYRRIKDKKSPTTMITSSDDSPDITDKSPEITVRSRANRQQLVNFFGYRHSVW